MLETQDTLLKEIEGYSDKKGYKQDEVSSGRMYFSVIKNYPFAESLYKDSMVLIPYMAIRA